MSERPGSILRHASLEEIAEHLEMTPDELKSISLKMMSSGGAFVRQSDGTEGFVDTEQDQFPHRSGS